MMLKITKSCHMGCPHCMNDAKPSDEHMTFDVLKKAVRFLNTHMSVLTLISGGEPTEHPDFPRHMEYILENTQGMAVTLTTNGIWLQDKEEFVDYLMYKYPMFNIQVSSMPGLYPKLVDTNMPLFKDEWAERVVLCRKVERMYPQGRALSNGLSDGRDSKACKCFNVRALAGQKPEWGLGEIVAALAGKGLSCTPYIAVDGSIKLGESDLCPVCSHIDKSDDEIIHDILYFTCHQCSFINKKLDANIRKLIGE